MHEYGGTAEANEWTTSYNLDWELTRYMGTKRDEKRIKVYCDIKKWFHQSLAKQPIKSNLSIAYTAVDKVSSNLVISKRSGVRLVYIYLSRTIMRYFYLFTFDSTPPTTSLRRILYFYSNNKEIARWSKDFLFYFTFCWVLKFNANRSNGAVDRCSVAHSQTDTISLNRSSILIWSQMHFTQVWVKAIICIYVIC